jgi:hypothetical protein
MNAAGSEPDSLLRCGTGVYVQHSEEAGRTRSGLCAHLACFQGNVASPEYGLFYIKVKSRSREQDQFKNIQGETMNDTLDGIASTLPALKPVSWKMDKIHAAVCIFISSCLSLGLIAWGVHSLL